MPTKSSPRIGVLTGGGDCPGLNAVIRAVTQVVHGRFGGCVIGIEDGFDGLLHGRLRELSKAQVAGLISQGGTVLGTTNKGDPWLTASPDAADAVAARMLQQIAAARLDALIVIGGDGSMTIAQRLSQSGVPIVGVPKTIDNDLLATDVTFGFDSAVAVIAEALDRLATTAAAHRRAMVLEVMGRDAGWLALAGGLAGGADVILLPEVSFDWPCVAEHVRDTVQHGRGFALVCVAEGIKWPVEAPSQASTPSLGRDGVGAGVARVLQARSGIDSRAMVLGHLQRGGSPSAADRILATRLGVAAATYACQGMHGVMVAVRGTAIEPVALAVVAAGIRRVAVDHDWLQAARALGTCLGDSAV